MRLNVQPFTPVGATASLSASAASASGNINAGGQVVRIFNVGPNIAFVRWGVGAQTAVATDLPIPVGAVELFSKGLADTVAAIAPAGTATVYATTGEGQ